MRREDKRWVPPRLKVKLPPGYHLKAIPHGYALYVGYQLAPGGRLTTLICGFSAGTNVKVIEEAASIHAEDSKAKEV